MSQDKQENLLERAVKGWTDLSRRSISDASRFALSITEAGSRLMLDTSRTLGAWASDVTEAVGKARDLVGRDAGEQGKKRGEVASDIAAQLGSAYSAAVRGYSKAVRKSIEHFALRYADRDPGARAAAVEHAAAPETGTASTAKDTRPE
jgi:hypothetical protein